MKYLLAYKAFLDDIALRVPKKKNWFDRIALSLIFWSFMSGVSTSMTYRALAHGSYSLAFVAAVLLFTNLSMSYISFKGGQND